MKTYTLDQVQDELIGKKGTLNETFLNMNFKWT